MVKRKNKKKQNKSQEFHKFIPITEINQIPTNEDVISLLYGMKQIMKIKSRFVVVSCVADVILSYFQSKNIDIKASKALVKKKINELKESWSLIQKNLGAKKVSNLNETHEKEFKASLKKTFAVGAIRSGNPRLIAQEIEGK